MKKEKEEEEEKQEKTCKTPWKWFVQQFENGHENESQNSKLEYFKRISTFIKK